MHEFSIALSILDIVTEAASTNQINHISSVEVEVGQVSGVIPDALEFAWESARKNSPASGASLVIRQAALQTRCLSCGYIHHPADLYETCPTCGEIRYEIITGRELRVTAIVT